MAEFRYQDTALSIRNPDLGNTLTLNLRTTIKRAISGRFWAFRATPMRRTLEVTFSHLNRNKVLQADSFFQNCGGQVITYVDHHDVQWSVVVVNHPRDFVHTAIRNNTFSLQLEVVNG